MTVGYRTVYVTFEYARQGSDNRRVNRAVITVYGESEFAVVAELRRQYPDYADIVILNCEFR